MIELTWNTSAPQPTDMNAFVKLQKVWLHYSLINKTRIEM